MDEHYHSDDHGNRADYGQEERESAWAAQTATGERPPWWMKMAAQFGFGAIVALLLLNWLQSSVDRKLDQAVAAAQDTKAAQAQANREMTVFAQDQIRYSEIMLLVQRQTCANTAKSEEAQARCYGTTMK